MPGIFLALPFCLCYTELAAISKAAYSLPYFVHFLTPPLLRHISLFKLCKNSCNEVLCARAAIHRGAATMPFFDCAFCCSVYPLLAYVCLERFFIAGKWPVFTITL